MKRVKYGLVPALGLAIALSTSGTAHAQYGPTVAPATADSTPVSEDVEQATLARTGTSSIGPLLGIGGAAVVLGGAFVYGAKRREADKA